MSTLILARLQKHAQRIKAECGWMSTLPEICADLKQAAETIETLERLLSEANKKAREAN